jgi:hypothetical protein
MLCSLRENYVQWLAILIIALADEPHMLACRC